MEEELKPGNRTKNVSKIISSITFSIRCLQPNKKIKNVPKIASARPPVTSVKVRRSKAGKGGGREKHDLIVEIDMVSDERPDDNN